MILHGRLLQDPRTIPLPGWVSIDGARLTSIGTGPPPAPPDAGGEECIICPGFVDAHVHLPQFTSIGCDGLPLLQWLERVIFPAETSWSDHAEAQRQAGEALRRMLRAGTTACAAFLTSHEGAIDAVRDAHRSLPLRIIAGQSLMDRSAPRSLLGHAVAALLPAGSRGDERIASSVNPRFALTCTESLLAEAAARANGAGAIVHTHLAESIAECAAARELFPAARDYLDVYERHGLVHERTLLAHCLHLNDDEWRRIAARRAVVVHCPTANTFLEAGTFDLTAARRHGVRLALGSDVAAGSDVAMPRVARAMIDTAKMRRMTVDAEAPVPSPAEAWQMITRGNADALGMSDAGRLEVGASADLLVLRPDVRLDEQFAGRLLYGWDEAWIEQRVLAGRLV